jgi:hypothetical protein
MRSKRGHMPLAGRVLNSLHARLERRYSRLTARQHAFLAHVSPDSLLWYYGNVHSQRGQDGILREIFFRLDENLGLRFVEFGAWDGVYLSNCRWLAEQGWEGTFIEASREKFRALEKNYRGSKQRVIHGKVGAPRFGIRGERLSTILLSAGLRTDDVSFISVDVDGPDLEVFLDAGLKPAVALIEGGFNLHPAISNATPREHGHLQHSLGYIVKRLAEHGYTAVCFFQDTYAIRNDLMLPFGGVPQSPLDLYRDAFCFMDEFHRSELLRLRERSREIHAFESRELGAFTVSPDLGL